MRQEESAVFYAEWLDNKGVKINEAGRQAPMPAMMSS